MGTYPCTCQQHPWQYTPVPAWVRVSTGVITHLWCPSRTAHSAHNGHAHVHCTWLLFHECACRTATPCAMHMRICLAHDYLFANIHPRQPHHAHPHCTWLPIFKWPSRMATPCASFCVHPCCTWLSKRATPCARRVCIRIAHGYPFANGHPGWPHHTHPCVRTCIAHSCPRWPLLAQGVFASILHMVMWTAI